MEQPPKPRKQPSQSRSKYMVSLILEATARVLEQKGFTGTNTNLIAEQAGISVGSIYQYFPNKKALIVALHEQHAKQRYQIVHDILLDSTAQSLYESIHCIVRAILQAHLIEPNLHNLLENEFPFFDSGDDENNIDYEVYQKIKALLVQHKEEVAVTVYDEAAWVIIRLIESLVHGAVLSPPKWIDHSQIDITITHVIMGYLTFTKN